MIKIKSITPTDTTRHCSGNFTLEFEYQGRVFKVSYTSHQWNDDRDSISLELYSEKLGCMIHIKTLYGFYESHKNLLGRLEGLSYRMSRLM